MKPVSLLLLFLLSFVACDRKGEGELPSQAHRIFEALSSKDSGIGFSNNITENDTLNYLTYPYIYMGGWLGGPPENLHISINERPISFAFLRHFKRV